ncbi:MAG TPA: YciI family protein [Candidatus Sulfotelmatobacter sp.]|nr:YciI family protein [Candidatus Sulfotelmatobacter sp.]
MQYMMLIYLEENAITEEERANCYQESAAYARKLNEEGKFIATSPLQPTSTATSIRQHGGKRVIRDGPFAETREQLGGFFIVEAQNRDEALEIASRIPAGRFGTVEVRPLVPVAGIPPRKAN